MVGNLSEKAIEHLLMSQLVGRIGCQSNSKMYIVPICYAYSENCIYARTFEGMKLEIMRENSSVCFQLEQLETMGDWQSAICWGEFEELTEPSKRNKGLKIIQNRVSGIMGDMRLQLSPHWPFSVNNKDDIDGVIFCIHISEKTGRFENIHKQSI